MTNNDPIPFAAGTSLVCPGSLRRPIIERITVTVVVGNERATSGNDSIRTAGRWSVVDNDSVPKERFAVSYQGVSGGVGMKRKERNPSARVFRAEQGSLSIQIESAGGTQRR
jgi:hypothetical protein